MKKTIIATLILLNAGLVQAMESNKEEGDVVKINIAAMPCPPVYAGKCTINVDFQKTDIRKLLQDNSIQPQDLLQEVWAWKDYPDARLQPDSRTKHPFPLYLPYKYLEKLKENETLDITFAGKKYKLKAHQYGCKYHKPEYGGAGSFEGTLASNKCDFNKTAGFRDDDDKDYLLKKSILHKTIFGTITHGSNTIPLLVDKNGKRAGVVAQCFHQLKYVLKNGI